jgi:hypothetical protein
MKSVGDNRSKFVAPKKDILVDNIHFPALGKKATKNMTLAIKITRRENASIAYGSLPMLVPRSVTVFVFLINTH